MTADVREDRSHILRHSVIPALHIGMRLCHPADGQRTARAEAQLDHRVVARRLGQLRHIFIDRRLHFHGCCLLFKVFQILRRDDRVDAVQWIFCMPLLQNTHLTAKIRIAYRQLYQKAVQLRIRQQLCARGARRVLRGQHNEGGRQRVRLPVDADVSFLHRLEQRGLRLARRPVDLISQQQIRHHRAGLVDQFSAGLVIDAEADDVGRHGVGRELHAPGLQSQHAGERHCGRRLANARHVLHQHMSSGQNGHQDPLHHVVLADDDGLNLLQYLLDFFTHIHSSVYSGVSPRFGSGSVLGVGSGSGSGVGPGSVGPSSCAWQ